MSTHSKFTNQRTKYKRIFLSPPHMGSEELRFVHEAFESNYVAPLGPQVDAFEREFAEKVGVPYVLAVSSGTAAMHLALRILGLRVPYLKPACISQTKNVIFSSNVL